MNRAVKIGIAGTSTALLVVGGIGAYSVVQALSNGTTDSSEPKAARSFDPATASSEPPSDAKAVKLTRTFLDSWSKQHLDAAAGATDSADTAASEMRHYAEGLHLKALTFQHIASAGSSTVTPGAAKVTFEVTARVAGGTWTYQSAVAVLQSTNGLPAVHWNNSVLYPGLGDDQSLTAGRLPADAVTAKVVARDGKADLSAFPS
ncbi:NTF2-like N-terminal transpeptidase domain-containing protein, partial [Streptomyces sp. SAS_270]|uniref:NTF2-like N-terminal transpeptidase domain-containing protein n=1 Tax=Streptomyces sp. SAS_270 TaxID=3412748 RepID=UPI00403C7FE0